MTKTTAVPRTTAEIRAAQAEMSIDQWRVYAKSLTPDEHERLRAVNAITDQIALRHCRVADEISILQAVMRYGRADTTALAADHAVERIDAIAAGSPDFIAATIRDARDACMVVHAIAAIIES